MAHALIGPKLLGEVENINRDYRDVKLQGYVLRTRASGVHSYLVSLGRGRWTTIGRVGKMTPEAARLAAEALLTGVSRDAIRHLADDPTITLRDARARARGDVRVRRTRRATFGQFLTDTYEPWVVQHRKTGDETVARLRSRFKDLLDVKMADFSAFTIERWRSARLKAGKQPSTVNRDLAALRSALSKAVEWRILTVHPMTTVKAAKVDTVGRVRYLTPDEEKKLLDALDARDAQRRAARDTANIWRRERAYDEYPPYGPYTDHLAPLVLMALHTGLRRGELFDLTWRDVNLTAARVTVRSETAKAGKARVVPLNTRVVTVLKTWKPAEAGADDRVFPGADGGRLEDIKTAFLSVVRTAGLRAFRFHDLRHTFASKLVMAGVDLNTTRELLGHADLKMTTRYAHLSPEHRAAAVEKLVGA